MTKTSKLSKRTVEQLGEDMKKALRAASVFLTGKQRAKLQSFLQAPFTGNYNAQSGEIVGVLKNMNDTFTSNLASARQNEEKKQKEYDEMMEVKTAEYEEMEELFEAKKKEIGDNAAQISTISSEVETMEAELAADQEFLAALTERCSAKKAEFEKRNMLRAGEEAAIAVAISDGNPFKKVLEMINKTIGIIEAEEADDVEKKETCIEEQTTNEANKKDKETDIQTLEANINELKVA